MVKRKIQGRILFYKQMASPLGYSLKFVAKFLSKSFRKRSCKRVLFQNKKILNISGCTLIHERNHFTFGVNFIELVILCLCYCDDVLETFHVILEEQEFIYLDLFLTISIIAILRGSSLTSWTLFLLLPSRRLHLSSCLKVHLNSCEVKSSEGITSYPLNFLFFQFQTISLCY